MVAATDNDKFIFERVRDRYEFEHDRFLNIQSRASTLVGWIGLFISILVAGGAILFGKKGDVTLSLDDVNLILAALALLLISMLFSLIAFRVGAYEVAPEPGPLIEFYGDGDEQKTLRTATREMTNAIEINTKSTDMKANFVTVSWALFLGGMILSSIFISIQMYKLVP